jgi:hypothetical protein
MTYWIYWFSTPSYLQKRRKLHMNFLIRTIIISSLAKISVHSFYSMLLFTSLEGFCRSLSLSLSLECGFDLPTFLGCFCLDTKWLVIWRLFVCGFIEKVRVFQLLLLFVWFINSWLDVLSNNSFMNESFWWMVDYE